MTRAFLTALALLLVGLQPSSAQTPKSEPKGPWDIDRIIAAKVEVEWGATVGKSREVYYLSEPLKGKPTRVFAYYAKPATGAGPFPTVLLLHGGGGKAFREWAEHWADRGYCALAMDLSGNGPKGRLPDGGPDQTDDVKFQEFTAETATDMWTYHAVAAVIRGHTMLRTFAEVDKERVAVTGISWGGYLTCIVAGVDRRLKAAVPVYGCGYLHDSSVWKVGRFDKMTDERRNKWVGAFDPSTYLPGVRCPILFLNGTNDYAYPLDSYKRCFDLVPGPKTLSVRVRLPHGHIWTFGEVDAFIDSHLKGGDPLPKLGEMNRSNAEVTATFSAKSPLKAATLNYAEATGPWQQREWKSAPAKIADGVVVGILPANRPLVYFLSVTDSRGSIVSNAHDTLSK